MLQIFTETFVTLNYLRYLVLVLLIVFGAWLCDGLSKYVMRKHPWAKHEAACEKFCKMVNSSAKGSARLYPRSSDYYEVIRRLESMSEESGTGELDKNVLCEAFEDMLTTYKAVHPLSEDIPDFLDNRGTEFKTFEDMRKDFISSRRVVFVVALLWWVVAILPLLLYLISK